MALTEYEKKILAQRRFHLLEDLLLILGESHCLPLSDDYCFKLSVHI